jgi:hypothetical protein
MTAAATGPDGAVVTFPLPTVQDDVDPSPRVACSPASGSLFPIGTTTVECSATDAAGLTSRLWFDVTVVDRDITPPVFIDVPADFSVEARRRTGAVVTYRVPSASDAADANPTVECSPASGTVFPVGTRTVTCTATDAAGNFSSATFRVTVTLRDSTAPTVDRVDLGGTTAISRLSVTFSEPMDQAEAQRLANFRLVAAGRDLRFGTPDDRAVALHSVWFDDVTRTTHVYPAQSPRSNQLVRLIVGASSLTDLAGNVLDGNADGNPGDSFSTIVGLGTRLSLLDEDGDVVSFRLTGPGTMQLRLAATGVAESLRLINTTSASLVSGSVRRARSGGDGRYTLPQLTLSPGAEFRSRFVPPLFRFGPIPSDEVDYLLAASGGTLAGILIEV